MPPPLSLVFWSVIAIIGKPATKAAFPIVIITAELLGINY
jgi:hypothetical protein